MEAAELRDLMVDTDADREMRALSPEDCVKERVKAVRVARVAQEIVNNGWCQQAYARDSDGKPTLVDADDAKSFCVVGAIRKADDVYDFRTPGTRWVYAALHKLTGLNEVFAWNDQDGRTKEEVLAALNTVEGAAELSLPSS